MLQLWIQSYCFLTKALLYQQEERAKLSKRPPVVSLRFTLQSQLLVMDLTDSKEAKESLTHYRFRPKFMDSADIITDWHREETHEFLVLTELYLVSCFTSFDWWQEKRCLTLKVKLPESTNGNKGGHYPHFILKIMCYLVFSALRDVHNLWISHKYMKNQCKERKHTRNQSDLSHTDNNESMIVRATQTNSPDRASQTSPGLLMKKENLCSLRIAI